MKFPILTLLSGFILVGAPAHSAERHSPEYDRRERLIRNAVDTAPLPDTNEIGTGFGYDESRGFFLQIHWRTGRKSRSSPEEMDAFRRLCFAITRKLVESLPDELDVTHESEVSVSEERRREFPIDNTFVRRGVIPLHFKKDAKKA
jgi:hypothetical protein